MQASIGQVMIDGLRLFVSLPAPIKKQNCAKQERRDKVNYSFSSSTSPESYSSEQEDFYRKVCG